MVVRLKDIIVPKKFSDTTPSESKMVNVRSDYHNGKNIEQDIVIDENRILTDGYIRYLVLIENNIVLADVSVVERNERAYRFVPTMYVFGKHHPNGKTYVWRMARCTKDSSNLCVGNRAIVATRHGKKRITVDDIRILDNPPVEYPVRKVLRCLEK